MSKKKTTTVEQETPAVKNQPKKKMSKKEKKALAEQRSKEMNQKKTRNYGIGFVLSLIAVAISFLYKPETGTDLWSYTQMGCYAIMGAAGLFLKNGAKYEEKRLGKNHHHRLGSRGKASPRYACLFSFKGGADQYDAVACLAAGKRGNNRQ